MPELPEAETIRRGLASLVGAEIKSAGVFHRRMVRERENGAAEFAQFLPGRRVLAVARRGKFLWIVLSDLGRNPLADQNLADTNFGLSNFSDASVPAREQLPKQALLLHLGMSGQALIYENSPSFQRITAPAIGDKSEISTAPQPADELGAQRAKNVPARWQERQVLDADISFPALEHPHLRAQINFADGRALCFIDQRTFGKFYLTSLSLTADGQASGCGDNYGLIPEPVKNIARDLLDPCLNLEDAKLLEKFICSKAAVKNRLLDQSLISGIGNIYADEALGRAGIHPALPACALAKFDVLRLLRAAKTVMEAALLVGGTSFDELYVNASGTPGYFARSLKFYGRAGENCLVCEEKKRGKIGILEKTVVGGRSSVWCPQCQKI